MALPVQSVRAAPEHRDVLSRVAALLAAGHADVLRDTLASLDRRPIGPFRNEDAALAFIRDRLVARLRPRMVWLFGSRARGDARPDSDFDILVVLPDGLPAQSYAHMRVAEPVVAAGIGVDVVPCRWSDFLEERGTEGTLAAAAFREGRLLYQEPALRRADGSPR